MTLSSSSSSSSAAAKVRAHDRPGGRVGKIGKTKKLLSSLFSFIGDHQIIGEVAAGGGEKKTTVRSNSDDKEQVVAVVVAHQQRIASSSSFGPQCRTRPGGGTGGGTTTTRWSRFQRQHSSIVDHLHVARISMETERSDDDDVRRRLPSPARDAIAAESNIREAIRHSEEGWRMLGDMHAVETRKKKSKFSTEELDEMRRS